MGMCLQNMDQYKRKKREYTICENVYGFVRIGQRCIGCIGQA